MSRYSGGADVAGIWAALARLPGRAPEQRAADRRASAVHRTADAMAAGRRYRTRQVGQRRRSEAARWRTQARDAAGRFVSA